LLYRISKSKIDLLSVFLIVSIMLPLTQVCIVKGSSGWDFVIDVIASDKLSYNVGETARIWARIENMGTEIIDSYYAKADFTVRAPSGSTVASGSDTNGWPVKPGGVNVFELDWTIPSNAEAGYYTVDVTVTVWEGVNGEWKGATHVKSASKPNVFSVSAPPPPDFQVSATPSSVTVSQGQTATYTVTVISLNGWTSPVTLSTSLTPSGASISFSPNPVAPTGTSTLGIGTSASTQTGAFNFVIIGTSGTTQHTYSGYSITVNPISKRSSSISISASPSSITPGQSITVTGSISPAHSATVTITYRWRDGGTSAWQTLATVSSNSGGAYSYQWTPSFAATYDFYSSWSGDSDHDGAQSSTATVTAQGVTIDFTIEILVSDKTSYNVGEQARLWCRIKNTGSIEIDTARADFTLLGPDGSSVFTGTDWTNYLNLGSLHVFEVDWNIPSDAQSGLYTIRVNVVAWQGPGQSGSSVIHSAQTNNAFSVNAPPAPDFALSVSPTSQVITQGQSTTFSVTVNSLNGWTASVSLSVSGLPSGAESSFSTNPVNPTGTSTLSISTSQSTSTGQFSLVIIGNGDGRQHTTTATLIIQSSEQPEFDFSISISPSSATVERGKAVDACTVTITLLGGTTGRVDLSLSGLPSNVGGYAFSPPYGNATFASTLSTMILGDAPTGTYTLTITGSGGGKTHSTTIVLTVNAPPTPPSVPSPISPSDGASLTSTSVTFTWSSVSGAADYQIEVIGPTNILETVYSTSYTTTLSEGSYNWRVRAHNSVGWSSWTSTWTFTYQPAQPMYFQADHASFAVSTGFANVVDCRLQFKNGLSDDIQIIFILRDSNGNKLDEFVAVAKAGTSGLAESRRLSLSIVGKDYVSASWEAYTVSDVQRLFLLDKSRPEEEIVFVSEQGNGPIFTQVYPRLGPPATELSLSQYSFLSYRYPVRQGEALVVKISYVEDSYPVKFVTYPPFVLPVDPERNFYVFIPDTVVVDEQAVVAIKGTAQLVETHVSSLAGHSGKWYVYKVRADTSWAIWYTWDAEFSYRLKVNTVGQTAIFAGLSTLKEELADQALDTAASKIFEWLVRQATGGKLFGPEDIVSLIASLGIDYISSSRIIVLDATSSSAG